jgi:hypothetical protein
VLGVAVACEGLQASHRPYLAAGGLDFIIGDGKLRYGPEEILETYYSYEVRKGINVTLDTQAVNHPAYNRDRGPLRIGGVRMHFEYQESETQPPDTSRKRKRGRMALTPCLPAFCIPRHKGKSR